MRSIKRILCTFQFDEPSLRTLGVALAAARVHKARLILATIQPALRVFRLPGKMPALQKVVDAYFTSQITMLLQHLRGSGVAVQTETVQGDPSEEVLLLAERKRISAVFVPSDSRTGWELVRDGSLAEEISCHARCPVYAVNVVVESEDLPADPRLN